MRRLFSICAFSLLALSLLAGVQLKEVMLSPALQGAESQSHMRLLPTSGESISLVEYSVTCGGVTSHGMKNTIGLSRGTDGSFLLPITYQVPATAGRYATTVQVTAINGDAVSGVSAQATTAVVSRQAKRYTLVEENTGTGCGNCPRGWLGMQKVKEQAADIAGVVAIHQYNADDPMYIADYCTPPFSGAPACCLDRILYPDPLEGLDEEGIIDCLRTYNAAQLPTVALSVSAHLNAAHTGVEVSSTTEFLTEGKGYTIGYVITADGLTGTGTSWYQTNYLSDNSSWIIEMLYPGSGMEIFGSGGKYGQAKVRLVYDDVLIASTWTGKSLSSSALKFTSAATTGTTESHQATVALPTSATLLKAIDLSRLNVTVVVMDQDGKVANAARCKVETTTAIRNLQTPLCSGADAHIESLGPASLKIEGKKKTLLRSR